MTGYSDTELAARGVTGEPDALQCSPFRGEVLPEALESTIKGKPAESKQSPLPATGECPLWVKIDVHRTPRSCLFSVVKRK
jgi:hypothetical protein